MSYSKPIFNIIITSAEDVITTSNEEVTTPPSNPRPFDTPIIGI